MLTVNSKPFHTASTALPLVVNLEEALLRPDALQEGLIALLRDRPFVAPQVLYWRSRGSGYLWTRVAQALALSSSSVAYRPEVLQWLQQQTGRRPLFLATNSKGQLAEAVAGHLGIFEAVLSSTHEHRPSSWPARLAERFGPCEYEYLTASTLPSLVTGPVKLAAFPGPISLAQLLRVHQWLKNLLVFVPAITSHRLLLGRAVANSFLMFVSLCCCASATYIVNDLFDLEADRRHATKRHRPLASSQIRVQTALRIAIGLLAASFAIAQAYLPLPARLVLLLYVLTTLAYSIWLKRFVLVDVFLLTSLYCLRVGAGGAAAAIRVSEWTAAFFMFLFLSLALLKRYVELAKLASGSQDDLLRRGYRKSDQAFVEQCGITSGLLAVLVFALYINSVDVHALYRHPERLWLLCPILAFGILFFWLRGHRGEVADDPVLDAATNPSLLALALGGALIVLAATL